MVKTSILAVILLVANLSLDDIVLDIYNAVTELGEIDYEENIVRFEVEPLPVDVTSRSGKITVSLSDGALLGTLTVNQTNQTE